MNPELGAVRKTVRCPAKYSTQAPLWKDILLNIFPMLVLAFFVKALFQGAGMSDAAAAVIFVLVAGGFTFFCVYVTRASRARYAEMCLNIHERGLSGTTLANAFKSRSFAFPYSELKDVSAKKIRLTLRAASGSYNIFADDAEALAAELKQYIGYLG